MSKMASVQARKVKASTKTSLKTAEVKNTKKAGKKTAAKVTVLVPAAALSKEKKSVKSKAAPASISQKLLETIEKRKQAAESKKPGSGMPGRPRGRRGRRPKNMEYTPQHNEEDSYTMESEYETLEYDTGIRVKDSKDEFGGGLDRFDDFDEELNFDR
jgi:hypothetical protein